MNITYTSEQLDDLEQHLEKWLSSYELGEPEVTDDYYDHYKRLLQQLRPNSKFLKKIGNKPKKNVEKLPFILGSLLNKFEDDINSYLDKIDNNSGFTLSFKLDGVAILCEYTDGQLTGAWLRGDHITGENITHKAIKFAPQMQHQIKGTYYFKGEILFKPETDYVALGYKNARNGVAGIINRDDLSLLNHLCIVFHTFANPKNIPAEFDRLSYLEKIFGKDNVVRNQFVQHKMML